MSFNKDQQDGVQESGGAEDLSAALSEPEAGFITEQPKKQLSAGTLAVGGLVVLIAGAVYFMYLRNGPQAAKAADATSSATTTINQFLSGGQNAAQMKQMLDDTEKAVQQFRNNDPAKTQVPIAELKTNPFSQPTAAKTGNNADREAKKLREEMVKAVQALKVQSVIHGGKRKAAMINGTLYQEGQQVGQFVVEKIGPGSVIVRNGKSRFELKMQR